MSLAVWPSSFIRFAVETCLAALATQVSFLKIRHRRRTGTDPRIGAGRGVRFPGVKGRVRVLRFETRTEPDGSAAADLVRSANSDVACLLMNVEDRR